MDGIPQDQFLISTDEQLIAYVEPQLRVVPVDLYEEARSMQQQECQVDISGDPNRFFARERRGPFMVSGTRLIITIPFVGDGWICRYRTNTYWMTFPRAKVRENRGSQGDIIITIEQAHDVGEEEFKRAFESEIQLLRNFLGVAKTQVEAYNNQLPSVISSTIGSRRKRLDQHKGLSALLDIPLQARPGSPSLEPVRVEVRPPQKLPVPPKTGLKPEPGITSETYERILSVIRHEGRTFETTPGTYAKLDEEELRSVILAHLNGHFQGEAAGEVFRRNGKTDICIQENNRAAFVGECKVWQGAGQIPSAVDQLLSYLTWRDSKAALVIFNKSVKDFSSILENLPKTISEHRCFVRSLPCEHAGEWHVLMRSIEDEGRLVTVHIFAINIYTPPKKADSKARSA